MRTKATPRTSRHNAPMNPDMTLLMYSNSSAPKMGPTSVPTPPRTDMMTKSPDVIQYSAVFGWM